jgi:hypothetical protein
MEDKLYEAVASILLRITSLEKLLIDKGVIDKEDYAGVLQGSVDELQKVIIESQRNKLLS